MASSDMKRVGVALGVDGLADFKKSLNEVNSTIQTSRSEFKLAQSQYDQNTSSITKLKDTQKYLTSQTEDYTKKLNLLKSQLAEMESAENRDEAAIEKKKQQVNNTEASLNNYKNGLNDVTKALESGSAKTKEYADQIGKVADKTKDVGSSLTKNVTGPLLAVAAASEVAWKAMDDAYDNIVKMTGATGDSLDSLTDSYNKVYSSMPSEAGAVSNAIGEINTLWHMQGDELENTSKYYLQYSEITGQDVTEAIDSAYKIQQQWNLSQEDTNDLMGMIAKASQDTGKDVSEYTSFLGDNAAVIQEMGLTTEQAVNFFSQMAKAGVDGTSALTGLKKAATQYAKEGKTMSEGLGDLSDRLKDATTHNEAFAEVTDLVGSKNALMFSKMLEDGTLNLDGLEDQLSNYSDVVTETFDATQDPADKATEAYHSIQLTLADLGATIQGVLAPILESLATKLQGFSEWFAELDPNIKETIVVIGGIVAAIGPLLVVIGTLGTAVQNALLILAPIQEMLYGIGGAVTGLTGPILAVIAAIALVVIAIIDLWNNSALFRDNVTAMFDAITQTFQSFWVNILQPIWDFIVQLVTDIWTNNLEPLWQKFEGMIESISSGISAFMVFLQPILDTIFQLLGPVFQGVLAGLGGAFTGTVSVITNILGVCFDTISSIFSAIQRIFSGLTDFIGGVFTGNWSQAWNGIVGIFGGIWDGIISLAKAPINAVIGLVNGMISGVQSGINYIVSAVNSLSFDIPDWVPLVGGSHFGLNLGRVSFGRVPYLANGGTLLNGMAVVAEAGPELLMQNGNSSTVMPLSQNSQNHVDIIDYEKLARIMAGVMQEVQVKVDKRVLGQLVSEVK